MEPSTGQRINTRHHFPAGKAAICAYSAPLEEHHAGRPTSTPQAESEQLGAQRCGLHPLPITRAPFPLKQCFAPPALPVWRRRQRCPDPRGPHPENEQGCMHDSGPSQRAAHFSRPLQVRPRGRDRSRNGLPVAGASVRSPIANPLQHPAQTS